MANKRDAELKKNIEKTEDKIIAKNDNEFIIIDSLSFWYNKEELKALENISFKIKKGQFVSVLGHNGSGKSTFSKLLMGLLKPSLGSIIIDGVEMSKKNLNLIRKKVGIVFQNPDNQFIASSVEDDIAFGLSNRQVPPKDMQEIIDAAAKEVDVFGILDKSPENLSGGQKQRVAIASQIALKSDIIIFDESTSMLDPKGREKVVQIQKALRDQGKTIISITHFMDETIDADKIIVFKKGKLLMEGSPEKIFSQHDLLKETRLKMPFIYDLSLRLNKKNPKIKPTFKEENLLKQLWKEQ